MKNLSSKQRILFLILLVLIVKIIMTFILVPKPFGDFNKDLIYTGDSFDYIGLAENILNGVQTEAPKRVPLYSLFLLILFTISGGNNPFIVIIIQHLIYSFSIYIVYNIGSQVFNNRKHTWFLTILYIICPIFFIFSFRYSTENLAILFQLISFLYFIKFWRRDIKRIRFLLFSGIAAGLAILSRPVYILFPLILSGVLFLCYRSVWLNKFKYSVFLTLFSYSLIFVYAFISLIVWNYFGIMGKESSKVQMTFAYHYENYANNKPVYLDKFDEMKESMYKKFADSYGHYPSYKEKRNIHSNYIKKVFRNHWDIYLYLPLRYSYKFFQPGTELYNEYVGVAYLYDYDGIEDPAEHVSTTRLSAFLKEGYLTILWKKLNRGPGIFLYGVYSLVFTFSLLLGFIAGTFFLIRKRKDIFLVVLSIVLFLYTTYVCGSMIQLRYSVVFLWLFMIISVYGWNYISLLVKRKL